MKFEWANKEYAHDVYEQFKSYVITPPREQKRINTSGNENGAFKLLYILIQTIQVMVLNDKVYENISPQTLACWFMDDGGMNGSHSHGLQFRVSVILK